MIAQLPIAWRNALLCSHEWCKRGTVWPYRLCERCRTKAREYSRARNESGRRRAQRLSVSGRIYCHYCGEAAIVPGKCAEHAQRRFHFGAAMWERRFRLTRYAPITPYPYEFDIDGFNELVGLDSLPPPACPSVDGDMDWQLATMLEAMS